MKNANIVLLLVLILLLVNLIVTDQVLAIEKVDYNLQDIGQKIEEFVDEHEATTAGMSVAIFSAKETVYKNYFGYMNIEDQVPVTEDTVMEWGSVSKLLVWVSVMQLVEQGKIKLDEDVNTYLPAGFLKNRVYESSLTMLNLMNHNAGFEDSILCMSTGHEDRIISIEEYLSTFQPKQVYEPGKVVAYSNWGTTLAAYIVENVSGMPYDDYVRKYIFEPLGMNDSTISPDLNDNKDVKERRKAVKSYSSDLKNTIPNIIYIVNYPSGSCVSTAVDLQKFAQALLSEDTVLFEHSATYHELFTPSLYYPNTENPRNYHGFWVDGLYGTHVIGHGGNTIGFTSQLLLDFENGLGMVILNNQAMEVTYSQKMPTLLFGSYQGSRFDYNGLVKSSKTINHGPLKLYGLLSVRNIKSNDPNIPYGVISDISGVDYLSMPYGDYRVIGIKDIAMDLIFF
ncbi:MAG: serine hydrolase domain-containing protein [Thermoleophilia bacterium]|jgi:CubicO group peptidase (beta-lactamase class C family)